MNNLPPTLFMHTGLEDGVRVGASDGGRGVDATFCPSSSSVAMVRTRNRSHTISAAECLGPWLSLESNSFPASFGHKCAF